MYFTYGNYYGYVVGRTMCDHFSLVLDVGSGQKGNPSINQNVSHN